jgi:hypothetical protein
VKAERFWPAVPESIWDRIREEFTLPPVQDIEQHFTGRGEPETMRDAVRVFIDEGSFCPGFRIREGRLHPPVIRLFRHALELQVPHNIFVAWMVSPLSALGGRRPVDALDQIPALETQLTGLADRYRPIPAKR